MSKNENVDAVRAAVAALNSGDVDGYINRFDPRCTRWIAGIADPMTLRDVADSVGQLVAAFEPLRLREEALFGDGDLVCARWRLLGTHTGDFLGVAATLRDIAVESAEVYEVRDDRVVTVWTYQDPVELFRQIGAA